ncbi:MAG: prenyltransferase/squalene oxidase repeat-containing protein [Chthoniobacteraceae bacterium]
MKHQLLAALAFTATAFAQDRAALDDPKNLSLRNEVQTAIDRGLSWLKSQQKADGSWSSADHPALTALAVVAFQREPSGRNLKQPPEFLRKAYAHLRTFAKPDGGIYGSGLSNYNTSVVMMALLSTGEPKDEPLIEAARRFIAGQQATNMAKPETSGGFGYGPTGASPKRQHPDLDNTLVALEALRLYEKMRPNSELAGAKDLNWKAAADFISRTQNLAATNKEPWVSEEQGNKGGFIYFPGFSNAGSFEPAPGKTAWRSYGSMTYGGMLSLLYADVKADDPRVQGALGWLKGNFTLEKNPGMEAQGLFYYYHLMTKGLAAAGVDTLVLADGRKVDWKREVALKLLNLQKGDGHWVNDTGRWMESDPVLVTSYCVLALELIYHKL